MTVRVRTTIITILIFVIGLCSGVFLGYGWHRLFESDQTSVNQSDGSTAQIAGSSSTNQQVSRPPENKSVIIVFEPEPQFDNKLKSELRAKLADPYIDYYASSPAPVVSIHITSPEKEPGAWEVFAINSDGSYSQFFFGDSSSAVQDWWIPDCSGTCQFSDQFKLMYPQIVARTR